MTDFINDPLYPYHKEAADHLLEIEKSGRDVWMESMTKRWACKNCGISYTWWTQKCEKCSEEVKGFVNPQE